MRFDVKNCKDFSTTGTQKLIIILKIVYFVKSLYCVFCKDFFVNFGTGVPKISHAIPFPLRVPKTRLKSVFRPYSKKEGYFAERNKV